jgi:hypothetical protein
VVLDVTFEMFCEFVDAFGQQRDLNVCAACVLLMKPESIDFDCFFCHCLFLLFFEPDRVARSTRLGKKSFAHEGCVHSGKTIWDAVS